MWNKVYCTHEASSSPHKFGMGTLWCIIKIFCVIKLFILQIYISLFPQEFFIFCQAYAKCLWRQHNDFSSSFQILSRFFFSTFQLHFNLILKSYILVNYVTLLQYIYYKSDIHRNLVSISHTSLVFFWTLLYFFLFFGFSV